MSLKQSNIFDFKEEKKDAFERQSFNEGNGTEIRQPGCS